MQRNDSTSRIRIPMDDTCKFIGWLYTRSVNSRLANRLFGRAMVRPEQIPPMYIGK